MKIERRIILERHERVQLDFLTALRDSERVLRKLRWRAVEDAVAMGLTMRMIGTATGYSAAQVSRISTGKVRGASRGVRERCMTYDVSNRGNKAKADDRR